MSTRVHELAKELGLKSQELLERIQKWGLDVKANALASLDPPMVDRIRELMDQPAAGKRAGERAGSQRAVAPRLRRHRRRLSRQRRLRAPSSRRRAGLQADRLAAGEPGSSAYRAGGW